MKHKCFFVLIILSMIASCSSNNEVNGVIEFKKAFTEKHPGGLNLTTGWYSLDVAENIRKNNDSSSSTRLIKMTSLITPINSSIYESKIEKLVLSSKFMSNINNEESSLSYSAGKALETVETFDPDMNVASTNTYYGTIENLTLLTSLKDSYNNINLNNVLNDETDKSSLNANYYIEGKTDGYYLETYQSHSDGSTSWSRKELFYFDLNYEWISQSYFYETTSNAGDFSSLRIIMKKSSESEITVADPSPDSKPLNEIDLNFKEEKYAL